MEKLRQKGLLAAVAPCLGVLIQTLIFFLFFRMSLPRRAIAYLMTTGVFAVCSGIFLASCLPELANLSGAASALSRRSDRIWQAVYLLISLMIVPAVASLELLTFQTAAFGGIGFLIGVLLQTAGFYLVHWARLHNPHFVTPIILPTGDPNALATSGPYRWLRHPGYLAMALVNLAAPLLLGSLVALFPALAAVLLLVYRTGEEDSFLSANVPDYQEYRTKVRRRLIPGIW